MHSDAMRTSRTHFGFETFSNHEGTTTLPSPEVLPAGGGWVVRLLVPTPPTAGEWGGSCPREFQRETGHNNDRPFDSG